MWCGLRVPADQCKSRDQAEVTSDQHDDNQDVEQQEKLSDDNIRPSSSVQINLKITRTQDVILLECFALFSSFAITTINLWYNEINTHLILNKPRLIWMMLAMRWWFARQQMDSDPIIEIFFWIFALIAANDGNLCCLLKFYHQLTSE